MEISTMSQNIMNLAISLVYALVTLVISVMTLYMLDHFVYKNINFIEEIKQGNIAASIFYSVVLMFVAVIVSIAIN